MKVENYESWLSTLKGDGDRTAFEAWAWRWVEQLKKNKQGGQFELLVSRRHGQPAVFGRDREGWFVEPRSGRIYILEKPEQVPKVLTAVIFGDWTRSKCRHPLV